METIEEIRLANLAALLAKGPYRTQTALGELMGVSRKQANQWFGGGSARNISSKTIRALEAALGIEHGAMDHLDMGGLASHLARFDLGKLAAAIDVARGSQRGFSAATVLEAYDLIANPQQVTSIGPNDRPPAGAKIGVNPDGTLPGTNKGTVEDSRRKGRARKT